MTPAEMSEWVRRKKVLVRAHLDDVSRLVRCRLCSDADPARVRRYARFEAARDGTHVLLCDECADGVAGALELARTPRRRC